LFRAYGSFIPEKQYGLKHENISLDMMEFSLFAEIFDIKKGNSLGFERHSRTSMNGKEDLELK